MSFKKQVSLRQKRIWRIRRKVTGTAERPRLCVTITNKHIYAQAIDDDAGVTRQSLSTLSKDLRGEDLKANIKGAERLGAAFGERAKAAGITRVVFDRHGRRYHGCVKAFADAARNAGLEF